MIDYILKNFSQISISKYLNCLFISCIMCSGCNDLQNNQSYYFVGDSLIAGWPIDECFPSQIVYNYGLSGAGIKYLEQYNSLFNGQNVVILIGTNDSYTFSTEEEDNYVSYYLKTINAISDNKIYLISVLPRAYRNDPPDINKRISKFNNKVKSELPNYPKVTYVDVFDDFLYKDGINEQFYYDGLHLNIYGYELLSSKLLNKIQ